jgi:hypothetical protein
LLFLRFKPQSMYKKITLFALIVSCSGLVFQFLIGSFYRPGNDFNYFLFYILDTFSMSISSGERIFRLDGNYWNLFFSFLMVVGAISYYKSKEKETRLIRFMFSVLFVQHCVYFLVNLCRIAMIFSDLRLRDIVMYILSLSIKIFLLWFLYKSVIYLNKLRTLDFETFVYTESTEISFFKTNNWQRLLHLIIDSLIFGIIVVQLLEFLVRVPQFSGFFERVETQFGSRTAVMVFICIVRTVFYFTFETLFDASPAKFLTESRVSDDEGLKTAAGTVFKRSLFRNIPFDAISFLLKAEWHDSLSYTQVYKEKRTGIKGGWYFLLIPIFIFACYSVDLWENVKQRNQYLEREQKLFDEQKSDILSAIKTLDTTLVLQLNSEEYSSKILYLKVEKSVNNEVEFSVLHLADRGNSFNQSDVEKAYNTSKDTLERIKIRKADLPKLVLSKLKTSNDETETFEGITAIPQLKNQYIETCFQINAPRFSIGTVGTQPESLYFEIKNRGLSASIISIESNDENVNWQKLNVLPLALPRDQANALQVAGKDIKNFNVKITVSDSLNRKSIYEISNIGEVSDARIRLIK